MNKKDWNTQKLAMLGQLSAAILHNLQSPVTFIDSNNRYLIKKIRKKKNSENLSDDIIEILQENEEGITQIKELLNSIKSLVRNDCKPKTVPLNELLDTCKKIVLPQTKNQINIELKLLEKSPLIKANPSQIKQVFINLMVNSIEALNVNSCSPLITINCSKSDKQLIIRVEDNGSGIPETQLDSIFDWYTSAKAQGSGQGLAISKQIIEDHGGQIIHDTEHSPGTAFYITLPLESDDE
ncbi:MAG: ATP-binding protein [Lentisphaerales bacterium]|nr:ATP-binding protein [Lentisphaerales bacterium]